MSDAPNTTGEPSADIITSAGAQSLDDARGRREQFARKTIQRRALQAQAKKLAKELRDLEDKLVEDYAELGTDSMRTEVDGTRHSLYLSPDLWGRPVKTGVNDDDEPEATDEDWARANDALRKVGLGHMVVERFNINSFSAWLRGFRDEHGPNWREHLPAEFFDAIEVDDNMRVKMQKAK